MKPNVLQGWEAGFIRDPIRVSFAGGFGSSGRVGDEADEVEGGVGCG